MDQLNINQALKAAVNERATPTNRNGPEPIRMLVDVDRIFMIFIYAGPAAAGLV